MNCAQRQDYIEIVKIEILLGLRILNFVKIEFNFSDQANFIAVNKLYINIFYPSSLCILKISFTWLKLQPSNILYHKSMDTYSLLPQFLHYRSFWSDFSSLEESGNKFLMKTLWKLISERFTKNKLRNKCKKEVILIWETVDIQRSYHINNGLDLTMLKGLIIIWLNQQQVCLFSYLFQDYISQFLVLFFV
jgi:hypothetical protein